MSVFDGRTAADFLSDPDVRVAYGEEINKEMMVKSKVAPFIAKNPNDEGAIIKGVVGTLEMGNNFRVPFTDELLDAGARGNVKFNATEEELKKLSMFVKVDMIQHSVPSTETVLNPKSANSFRATAKTKLKNWGVRKVDSIYISGLTADCTNIVACGHHTSGLTNVITPSDKFCLADVSEAKARAEQGYAYDATGKRIEVPPLLPYMQEENAQKGYFETLNYYVMWIGSDAERDLKDDPNWVNAQKDAKDRGANNPLFTGSLGFWDGVLLLPFKTANKRQSGILRSDSEFTGFSNIKKYDLNKYAGASGIKTEINLFLGAGAGVIAVDQPANFYDWADKDDPRYMKAGTDKIFGFAKTKYNSKDNDDLLEDNIYNNKDFGVIAVVSPCRA